VKRRTAIIRKPVESRRASFMADSSGSTKFDAA
jgi:hypothetical protein